VLHGARDLKSLFQG